MRIFRMKRCALLTCALTLTAAPAFGETLLEIYQQATANDHQFQAARANLEAGRENRVQGRAGLLPNVGAEATWRKSDSSNNLPSLGATPVDPLDPDPTDEDSGRFRYGETTSKGYALTVRQPIFDLSAWQGYKRGKALANEAEALYADAVEDLILRSANAYFSILQAQDDLATARAEEEALRQQLQQSKQRFEVGLTAITEVHEAQAAYDSATARRLVADGNLRINFEALEALTGGAPKSIAPLEEEFPVTPPEPAVREDWVKLALNNNSLLKAAQFRAEAAEDAADVAKSRHLPTLYGTVSHGATETEFDELNRTIQDDDSTVITATLSVPLFAGGGVSSARRQAYAQYLAARETFLQTRRDVVQATRSNYQAVITSAATVKARAQAIVSSRSALEATQAGYDVGTRDLVDVLNAQRNLFSAQRDFFDALYTYIIAQLELRDSAGVLTADDVAQLSQRLDPSRQVVLPRD